MEGGKACEFGGQSQGLYCSSSLGSVRIHNIAEGSLFLFPNAVPVKQSHGSLSNEFRLAGAHPGSPSVLVGRQGAKNSAACAGLSVESDAAQRRQSGTGWRPC